MPRSALGAIRHKHSHAHRTVWVIEIKNVGQHMVGIPDETFRNTC